MRVNLILDDGTYKYIDNATKRKINAVHGELTAQNAIMSGSCTVKYKGNYKNEFKFVDSDDFLYKLNPCLEPKLIKEFA